MKFDTRLSDESTSWSTPLVDQSCGFLTTSLHHFGFVVESIQKAAVGLTRSMAMNWDNNIIHDPLQRVRVAFLRGPNAAEPALELVEPAGVNSPVNSFLRRGGGLHHICYEVGDLEGQLKRSRSLGDLIVQAPRPAVAFGGRRIAWVYLEKKLLVEYLER
jgi:methylmalonyl-CoA/ethylmalonyl-CoA epimerase